MKIPSSKFVPFAFLLAVLTLNSFTIEMTQAAWSLTTGDIITARDGHTATLLPNGKVLVAGGAGFVDAFSKRPLSSAELHDPSTGKWTAAGALKNARQDHTATLLSNGKVLVTGGRNGTNVLASVELYEPVAGTWTQTGTMTNARWYHTATLLPDGEVLITGGRDLGNYLASAELYDPASGTWRPTGRMSIARVTHTATLLPDGQVLVAGGAGPAGVTASVELYNPTTGTWTTTGAMNTGRSVHTATLLPIGKVLVAGGVTGLTGSISISSAELYNPASRTWTAAGSLTSARDLHTSTLLPNGKVLVAGGLYLPLNGGAVTLSSAELFNVDTGTWTTAGDLNAPRFSHTAILLPNAQVLIAGGTGINLSGGDLSRTELFDSSDSAWIATGNLNTGRYGHTATILPNGSILLAGGQTNRSIFLSRAELYDIATGTWTVTGTMNTSRSGHTATLLPNGKVLVAGGSCNVTNIVSSTEMYDLAAGEWTASNPMNFRRQAHTATLLSNGKVLVVGGDDPSWVGPPTAELYDPISSSWVATSQPAVWHVGHSATLLNDGQVLVAGGGVSACELYDPAAGNWKTTGSLSTTRAAHSASLLPNGKVLVAGGNNGKNSLSSAELYDPVSGTWITIAPLATARQAHTATLLPNGRVLIAGGLSLNDVVVGIVSSAEVFDPATGVWTTTGALNAARGVHTAALLLTGKVLLAGGENFNGPLSKAELYDLGLGFDASWQPQIATVTSPLNLGSSLVITGSQFRGLSEYSSGNTQNSSSDHPVVQLRNLESSQTLFLHCTNWSANSFASAAVWNFPPGYALATVFVNGIPSTGSVVNVSVPIPTTPALTDARILSNGGFQFSFTNSVGALFGVLATTNLSSPLSNWTALGSVMEISPGQFQFLDLQATNNSQRFYQVRSL